MTVLGTRYRLGSTSYIWPADILPNVRQLGPLVDDVELVLFEADDFSNLPDAAVVAQLNSLAQAYDLTYTVHLPLDLALSHPPSLERAGNVIACTRDLSPWAYVLHLDGRAVASDPGPDLLAHWRDDALRALEAVAAMVGDAGRLCVENLENYAPEHLVPLLDELSVGLCVDVGHLWLMDRDPLPFLEDHLSRTRVVHLHGIGTRDHQSLRHQGAARLAPVLDLLSARGYDGVVTLEVFNLHDFSSSRGLIAEILNGHR
jgi:adenosylcobalamin phosphodiesterase